MHYTIYYYTVKHIFVYYCLQYINVFYSTVLYTIHYSKNIQKIQKMVLINIHGRSRHTIPVLDFSPHKEDSRKNKSNIGFKK